MVMRSATAAAPGPTTPAASSSARKGHDTPASLRLPADTTLEFARELLHFLNGGSGRGTVRLVIDEEGMALERV